MHYYYIVYKDCYFVGYNDDGTALLEKKRTDNVWYFRTKEQAIQEAETAQLKKYVIKSI